MGRNVSAPNLRISLVRDLAERRHLGGANTSLSRRRAAEWTHQAESGTGVADPRQLIEFFEVRLGPRGGHDAASIGCFESAEELHRFIEPMFVMRSSQHEHLFGVKSLFERVFAFGVAQG
jgi:hypothetical protein